MGRSRRGSSYIVEASLIFPVIVAVTIMMMAAAVYFYGLTASCSDLNRMVRREAGTRSSTVFYNETSAPESRSASISETGGLLSKKVRAVYQSSYSSSMIFKVNKKNEYKAEAFVICEAEVLWNRQAVSHAAAEIRG